MNNALFRSNRIIFCWNTIDYVFSERVIAKLIEYDREPDSSNIATLLINCSGGDIPDAFAIIDAMRNLSIPIRTIGTGRVHSAATYLLIAGSKDERYITKHTEMLIHPYNWSSSTAKYTDLRHRRAQEDDINSMIIDFYRLHTKLPNEQIKSLLSGPDHFLDAKTALRYGFVDKIA